MASSTARSIRSRLLIAAVAIVLALFAFGYRFLALELTDDDYNFFAIGRQIQQFGAWPVRDLIEEGDPLHNVASAVLQALFGYRLAGEVFFDIAMLSVAAAVTFLLARAVSGSTAISAAVTVVAVLFAPRLYDYPKAVIPAVGLWLCFRYADRPSRFRALLLGAATGVAFLVRHDLGAYLGIASLIVLVGAQVAAPANFAAGFAAYAIALAVCVLPYTAYVQMHGGLVRYVVSARGWLQREVGRDRDPRPAMAFDFSRPLWERSPGFPVKVRWATELDDVQRSEIERRYRLEAGHRDEGRTWKYELRDYRTENLRAIVLDPRIEDTANIDRTAFTQHTDESRVQRLRHTLRKPPSIAIAPGLFTSSNAVAWLYFVTVGLPYLALAVLGVTRLRGRSVPAVWMKLLPVIAVAAAAAPLWLRGNLNESSRLADLAVPSAVLGAWLLARSLQPRRHQMARVCLAATATVAFLLTTGSVVSFGQVRHGVDAALVVLEPEARRTDFDRQVSELFLSPPPLAWLSKETGMRGAVEYIQRCTAPDDRILVYGFYPEIVFFSGRASAADRLLLQRGFWTQPFEQPRTIDAIRRAQTPIVLIDVDAAGRPADGRVVDLSIPLIDRYLSQHYVSAGVTSFGASTDVTFNVLVEKSRTPTGTYPPFALPCFAPGV